MLSVAESDLGGAPGGVLSSGFITFSFDGEEKEEEEEEPVLCSVTLSPWNVWIRAIDIVVVVVGAVWCGVVWCGVVWVWLLLLFACVGVGVRVCVCLFVCLVVCVCVYVVGWVGVSGEEESVGSSKNYIEQYRKHDTLHKITKNKFLQNTHAHSESYYKKIQKITQNSTTT